MKRYIKSDRNLYTYAKTYTNDIGEEAKIEVITDGYSGNSYYRVYFRHSENENFRQYGNDYYNLRSAKQAAQRAVGLI